MRKEALRPFAAVPIAIARNVQNAAIDARVHDQPLRFGKLFYVDVDALRASSVRLSCPLDSARVVPSFWEDGVSLIEHPKIAFVLDWLNAPNGQKSWVSQKSLAYYRNLSQTQRLSDGQLEAWIEARHRHFVSVLSSMREHGWMTARERGGVRLLDEWQGLRVNVASDGSLLVGDGGMHRLAAALHLGFGEVPACFGIVAVDALNQ